MSDEKMDPKRTLAGERSEILDALASSPDGYCAAKAFAKRMRTMRLFDELGVVCDTMRYYDPGDVTARVWAAQSLVDRGMPMAARDILLPTLKIATESNNESDWFEVQGLLGRAAKQIFIDHVARTPLRANSFLEEALAAYRAGYNKDPMRAYWHGGNIAALLKRKSLLVGGITAAGEDPAAFAEHLRKTLDSVPEPARDYWWFATSAEAELGRKRYDEFANELKKFLEHRGADNLPDTDAFAVNSMLRQLREVWALDSESAPPVARATLALLSRKLLDWSGPGLRTEPLLVSAESIAADRIIDEGARSQLQKAFGDVGPMAIDWWKLGETRARSVAAVYGPGPMGPRRVGTGFLIKVRARAGGDVGCFVLTNAHVIGDPDPTIVAVQSYTDATIRFEGYDTTRDFKIKSIPWLSPFARHDAALLEIEGCPGDIEPIPVTANLPPAHSGRRLYIIGHAGGNELSFSFEDNQLLDHEGLPDGHPRQQGVIHIHYRTPTMGGSSGSPVFVDNRWTAIGLHHSGSALMQKLNGNPGTYQANEGIALSSISEALGTNNWELCT
jgi:Trypsin-like peptidase domain